MHLGNAFKRHLLKILLRALAPRSFAQVSALSSAFVSLYDWGMKKKSSPPASANLPVSKQTAGGVAGAIVGGVVAGPAGAIAGAIAGTLMGNRAAQGKTLISSGTKKTAKAAAKVVKSKLPSLKKAKPSKTTAVKATTAKKSAPKAKKTEKPNAPKATPAKAKRRR